MFDLVLKILPKLKLIAEDERGASWQILLPDNRELVLIFTRKDYWRGGHYHTKPEISLLLTGKMRTRKIIKDIDSDQTVYEREIEVEKSAGETISNKAGEPHVTIALEEYWLIDWKVGAKIGEWETVNYPPYREIVDKQITIKSAICGVRYLVGSSHPWRDKCSKPFHRVGPHGRDVSKSCVEGVKPEYLLEHAMEYQLTEEQIEEIKKALLVD